MTFDKDVEDHLRREEEKFDGTNERKSRFTIEPVSNENVSAKKRARTASGGNQTRQIPQVQRIRRNAFSSASIASTEDFGVWTLD